MQESEHFRPACEDQDSSCNEDFENSSDGEGFEKPSSFKRQLRLVTSAKLSSSKVQKSAKYCQKAMSSFSLQLKMVRTKL